MIEDRSTVLSLVRGGLCWEGISELAHTLTPDLAIQQVSMKLRKSMREISEAIILGAQVKG